MDIEELSRQIVSRNAAARAESQRLSALAIKSIESDAPLSDLDNELASRLAESLDGLLPKEGGADELVGGASDGIVS